ncbi:MAG: 1-deoxy-D-xylulose-5-phosphate synthase [Muribaculaceae bacterium]|nr:1-deoxy-D-xylulose-5-phosphate synthase [Muribaculaceae bacterium]
MPVASTNPDILSTISSPEDVRRLSVQQLPQLCADIRRFLIDSLSKNPGHFASGMGAVELTVALPYVFNTPSDRIVWDVGHPAYPHKLLTGRQEAFATGNRKMNGISGFPNPAESDYDTFSAGHASNSISAALGMAMASKLQGDTPRRNVVAVIGDASISGGLAFEGLNNAANTPNNLLIILNDNDMSIDPNVGSLNSYLAQLTTSQRYNNFRYGAYRALRKMHLVDDRRKGAIMRFNNSVKSLLMRSHNIFEGLNIRYFGPFDGNDVNTIVKVLNDIKDMEGPRILHLHSTKGKGYAPAELNPAAWHAPGRFDVATGVRDEEKAAPDGRMKYQDVFGNTLLRLAQNDDKIVAVTAAMASGTSVSVMQQEMPERVFDVGISEGHAVTFAGGMAKDGMKPFVAIYSSFLQRAYDHIIHDVALMKLPVTFCIDRAGLVGEDGPTHHGAFDIAYLRTVPGMTLGAPRNEIMLQRMMYTAAGGNCGPMAIRYPRGKGRMQNPMIEGEVPAVEIGRGEKLRDGREAVALTLGPIADEAAIAIDSLEKEGHSIAHYDMVFAKPLDENLLAAVAATGLPILTVEDGIANGGMGSAVTEWLQDHGYTNKVKRLGLPDAFVTQGTPAQLAALCGIDAEGIKQAIKELLPQS